MNSPTLSASIEAVSNLNKKCVTSGPLYSLSKVEKCNITPILNLNLALCKDSIALPLQTGYRIGSNSNAFREYEVKNVV